MNRNARFRSVARQCSMAFTFLFILVLAAIPSPVDAQPVVPAPLGLRKGPNSLAALEQPADAWLGRDKVRHFGSSAAIQLMGYGGLRAVGASRGGSMIAASVVTLSAGIGKELWDARRGRQPSWRDLAWNVAGLVAGTGLACIGDPR